MHLVPLSLVPLCSGRKPAPVIKLVLPKQVYLAEIRFQCVIPGRTSVCELKQFGEILASLMVLSACLLLYGNLAEKIRM